MRADRQRIMLVAAVGAFALAVAFLVVTVALTFRDSGSSAADTTRSAALVEPPVIDESTTATESASAEGPGPTRSRASLDPTPTPAGSTRTPSAAAHSQVAAVDASTSTPTRTPTRRPTLAPPSSSSSGVTRCQTGSVFDPQSGQCMACRTAGYTYSTVDHLCHPAADDFPAPSRPQPTATPTDTPRSTPTRDNGFVFLNFSDGTSATCSRLGSFTNCSGSAGSWSCSQLGTFMNCTSSTGATSSCSQLGTYTNCTITSPARGGGSVSGYTNCYSVGAYTYCTDERGRTVTCTKIGSQTSCS